MKLAVHNAQLSHYMGGTERLIYNHLRNLLNYPDVEITVVTSKTKKPSEFYKDLKKLNNSRILFKEFEIEESLGLKIPYSSNNPKRWHTESLIFGMHTEEFYKENKFDGVIIHFSTDSLFIPQNQKIILHLNGVPLERSYIDHITLQRPDAIIMLSEFVTNKWLKLYPELAHKQIEMIHAGIDCNKFENKNFIRKNDIIFVGRFISIKGIEYLIKAIKLLNKNVKVILVGSGPEEKSICELIIKMGLEKNIIINGEVEDEELIELYNNSKIAVFPSYAKEGMLLAMMEASACGCAIITTNTCSMPEFIKDKVNGILVEPKNAQEISDAIELLLSSEDVQKRITEKAKRAIDLYWEESMRIKELYSYYKKITGVENG
jgi:glycosyltransferase involved in cell wall biosynthesis